MCHLMINNDINIMIVQLIHTMNSTYMGTTYYIIRVNPIYCCDPLPKAGWHKPYMVTSCSDKM